MRKISYMPFHYSNIEFPKGTYIKYDRNLGGRGCWWIAVSISNSDIMLHSNNDIILQGGGGEG